MQLDVEPQKLFGLMQTVQRPYYSTEPGLDHWKQLCGIAQQLNDQQEQEETSRVLIGGWHLDEESHGGYESTSGRREALGRGVLLYRGTCSEKSTRCLGQQTSYSVVIEAWKQENRVIFLAIQKTVESGYVGVDNHHGIDTTWQVIGLRIVDL